MGTFELSSEILASRLGKLGAKCDRPLPGGITDVCDDTREVKPGFVFVLRQGASPLSEEQADKFLKSAVDSGAAAVICDPSFARTLAIPCVKLPSPHEKLAELACAFYGNPSLQMKMIGVTGTNGKTTTTYLLESIGQQLGLKMGVIGTVCHRYPGYCEASLNTTPGTLKLYRLLHGMCQAGVDVVAMEVSSHGIAQGRTKNLAFDAAIWTNLGTDHLDFHKTVEIYAKTKQELFSRSLPWSYAQGKFPFAIYNAGDERVCDYIEEAYSMSDWGGRRLAFLDGSTDSCFDAPPLQLIDVRRQNHLWEGLLQFRGEAYPFAFPLAGRYNISNVLGAISAFLSLGYDIHRILDSLPKVAQVPGRLEAVEVPNGPHVLVDFAHTPEALENAILAVKDDLGTQGQLWTVFGAGGDRDPSKRPMMGAIAAKHADHVVITSDNPRTEDPLRIIEEISGGVPDESKEKCTVLPDRKDAIFYALQHAKSEDIVLIAGKGHEDYQILGTTKIHFDDREVVRSFAD